MESATILVADFLREFDDDMAFCFKE